MSISSCVVFDVMKGFLLLLFLTCHSLSLYSSLSPALFCCHLYSLLRLLPLFLPNHLSLFLSLSFYVSAEALKSLKVLSPVASAAAATLPVCMGMNISSGEREGRERGEGPRLGLRYMGEERGRNRGEGAEQVRAIGTHKDKDK